MMINCLSAIAARILSERKILQERFPADYRHGPLIDILLELYVGAGRSEASFTARTFIPPAPLQSRWLKALMEDGLARRTGDSVRITDAGIALVEAALGEMTDG